jgi:hypothetical protein
MPADPSIGKVSWVDLTVGDAPRIRDFYQAVVGWEPSPVRMGDYSDFNMNVPGKSEPAAGICHARGQLAISMQSGSGAGVWAMNRPSAGPGIAAAPAAPQSPSPIPPEVRQRLVGRWLRPDGGYVLAIENIAEDGKAMATYSNPRPINVAKAQASHEGGRTSLYVELRDTGYPGSYYTLNCEPGKDQLVGVYHHLGLNQTLDVNFVRIPRSQGGASTTR